MLKERTLIKDTPNKINQKVKLYGWVHIRRDHGKLIFIDLRDASGIIQTVFIPSNKEAHEIASTLRSEWVVEFEGQINERPEKLKNSNIPTGGVEMLVEKIAVFNESKTPPFEIAATTEVSEETRLKYRYLYLRREKMKSNIEMRHNVTKFFRDWLSENGFLEIETPMMTKGTPEGSREFIVPSRLHQGKFYVLPQSPQQFKQLLMVAGMEKYFQIARCFRDEDQRGDRQPEFTQIDLEMSFVDENDVINLIEKSVIDMAKTLFPEKKIAQTPFPKISYQESMEKYGNDKPDLRENKEDKNELSFAWIIDFPMFEYSEADKKLNAAHHPFTHPKDEDIELLDKDPNKVKAKAYDLVLNGYEIGGGSIRIHKADLQNKIFQILGLSDKQIKDRFGHILEAFSYGTPPHGGFAFGFDRLVMLLAGEPNIREVIPFPKTGDAKDLMMNAPSEIPDEQLKELGIKIAKSL